ncbi:Retrovirus-related Pol polyprotein from transposon TNT 1-94 [Bienertia sinuspersici]
MTTPIEPTNPLYLHPSEGTNSITVERLQGPINYRSRKRSMEISLASKRKIGLVTGVIKRDASDKVKQEAWDTCNNMVISWILANVSEGVKKSVIFLTDAASIWKSLEERFSVANGSRKHQLNKEIYEMKQGGKNVIEYYTDMKSIWEELESLRELPPISTMTTEIKAFVEALDKEKEEQILFQFLNGWMKLMEHRGVLKSVKEEPESAKMFSKGGENENKGGSGDGKRKLPKLWIKQGGSRAGRPYRGGRTNRGGRRFAGIGGASGETNTSMGSASMTGSGFTAQQLEQLMKMLPVPSKNSGYDTDEEMDQSYSGMACCFHVKVIEGAWIIDSGASNHMTGDMKRMCEVKRSKYEAKIGLPSGETSVINHTREVSLNNGMVLRNVLHVPSFRHNLLSVSKLVQEENFKVEFHSTHCVIQEKNGGKIRGVGRALNGLYYLVEEPLERIMEKLKNGTLESNSEQEGLMENQAMNATGGVNIPGTVWKSTRMSPTTLWHHRLGHAPIAKMKRIEGLKGLNVNSKEECLTCPLGKFTKLPYKISKSRAKHILEMIHIDIWGPYKVATRKGHRFFLTLVDDYIRVTWVQLLRSKSESYDAIKNFIKMGKN